tara:strand:- start:6658 stop:7122 length:465 start_codon:yes stop_codon:yes gene_type:complete
MSHANRIAGAIVMGACVAYFIPSLTFATPPPSSTDPGMAVWPQTLAVLGFLSGLTLFFSTPLLPERSISMHGGEHGQIGSGGSRTVLIGIVLTVLYAAAMKFELYFIATPVYVAAMLWLCGARSIPMIISVVIGTELVGYLVFFKLLGVPLLQV